MIKFGGARVVAPLHKASKYAPWTCPCGTRDLHGDPVCVSCGQKAPWVDQKKYYVNYSEIESFVPQSQDNLTGV